MSGAPGVFAELSELDPVGYVRRLGLRPEDSYGFIPVKLDEGSPTLYLYRDRPEYESARATPAGPRMPMMQQEAPGGGMFGGLIEQAQEWQRMYGGAAYDPGAAGDPMPAMPDVEKLAHAAKLRASGNIDDAEYARLRAEAGVPDPGALAAPPEDDPGTGPDIVAHRIYPGVRSRSSTMQLDHYLPRYCEMLRLRPEDVYGVFPWYSRTSSSGPDSASSSQWDDFWIVYRERPEYAAGRESWAKKMDKKGRWPEAQVYPGVGEPKGAASDQGDVEVEKDRWPREKMVVRKKGSDLGDALREKLGKWGYEPEDSYGFCPDFDHSAIYFAWRK